MAYAKINVATFGDVLPADEYIDNRVLAAGVAETITPPTWADTVVFSANADFWYRIGSAAAVPGTDVTDGTGSGLNPTIRKGIRGKTISVISSSACLMSLEWFTPGS